MTAGGVESVGDDEYAVLCCLFTGMTRFHTICRVTVLDRGDVVRCFRRLEERGLVMVFAYGGRRVAALTEAGVSYVRGDRMNAVVDEYRKGGGVNDG